jgi:transposase
MVFLSQDDIEHMSLDESKREALKYSNLCKANMAVIDTLEKQLRRMSQELGTSHQLVFFAQTQLDQLKGKTFGPSSEKRNDGTSGLPLFSDPAEPVKTEKITYERKKRTQFGRTPQTEIPRQEVRHIIDPLQAESLNLTPWEGQFEISEMITITPTQFVIQEHQRQKYHGKPKYVGDPSPIITAPGPLKLKENSRYSIEFGIHVGVEKYEFHQPLDRQVRWMKSHGLVCTSQVLFAQIDTIAWYLKHSFMGKLKEQILKERIHLADESYWENLGKKEQKKRFWIWALRSSKCILFEIFDSRTKAVALQFLDGLQGVLLTDGYAAYRSLASATLKTANDWCHVRRKVLAAEKTHPEEAKFLLEQIRALFLIEREIQDLSPDQRLQIRQEKSQIYINTISSKLQELENVLPKSPMGRAVHYAQKLWAGLTLFLSDSEIPIHSNLIEQAVRSPVLGRNNHLGSHSLETAQVAACWYSVIATCRAHNIDSRIYLEKILPLILLKKPFPMPWEFAQFATSPDALAPTQEIHLSSSLKK